MAFTPPLNLLGLTVSGDLADMTIYTDRKGQKVFFPRQHPKDAPSLKRMISRTRFKTAQALWKALTDNEKAALELASQKANLVMTGQNLWISCTMKRNEGVYRTIQNQTRVPLPPLPNWF